MSLKPRESALGNAHKKAPLQDAPREHATQAGLLPAVAIVTSYFVLAGCYLSRPGLAWDEALYVPYAESCRLWFAGLPATLNWNDLYNSLGRFTSHPPLSTYCMALATQLFADSMSRLYAARVASVFAMAFLLMGVYYFTLRARSVCAAVLSCVFLILMPQFFAHSLLATAEIHMALWWFVAAALFYAAMDNRKLALPAALAAAFAFLTKINAVALPLVLWPWGLYFYRKKALPAILYTIVIVPVVFFAGWPFLWAEPVIALGKYFGEKFAFVVGAYAAFGVDLPRLGDPIHRMITRTNVSVFYFGRFFEKAPWHYASVMTLLTTPVTVLLCAVGGGIALARKRESIRFATFLIWNISFWLLAFTVGLARPYDGTRLFLLVFPFVAILAAIGAEHVYTVLAKARPRRIAAFAVIAVFLLAPAAAAFFAYEPFGLSYYNIVLGGLPGAYKAGMPVTYWGETADDEIFNYINTNAPEGARLAAFPADVLYVENMRWFGLVRADINYVAVSDDWDFMIVANRGDALSSRGDIEGMTKDALVTKYVRGVPAAWLVKAQR